MFKTNKKKSNYFKKIKAITAMRELLICYGKNIKMIILLLCFWLLK